MDTGGNWRMSNSNEKQSVFRWAREHSGYSQQEVIDNLKQKRVTLQTLNQWENNTLRPTYPQLKKLSKLYKRPIALFFFPEPPDEQPIQNEFRSLPDSIGARIPPNIRYLVRKAKVRLMNLAELYPEQQTAEIFKWNVINGIDNSHKLAINVRDILGITINDQKQWQDTNEALNKWREAIEKTGIWVFKDTFHNDNYCGFCMYNRQFPIIYINNKQAKERQIFTLFHELGHILRGDGGIYFRTSPDKLTGIYERKEVFCNAFAGDFLLPAEILSYDTLPNDRTILDIAHQYKVSYDVVLRKYYDKGCIPWKEYIEKINHRKETSYIPKTTGGNYYATQRTYLGDKYINVVLKKYYQQHINREQVADYFDISTASISGIEERLYE